MTTHYGTAKEAASADKQMTSKPMTAYGTRSLNYPGAAARPGLPIAKSTWTSAKGVQKGP